MDPENPSRPPPPVQDDSELTRWDQSGNPQYINPAQTTYTPIDYQFRSKQPELPQRSGQWRGNSKKEALDDLPLTASDTEPDLMGSADVDLPKFATPRQDAVGRYMSTFKGRLSLRTSSTMVGLALGGFVGKSLFNTPSFSIPAGLLFLILTFFRNPYGELARALGLTLIFVWQRTFQIRKRYATWPHVKASLGMSTRRPFPRNDDFQSREISYVYTLLAMAFVGSAAGGNLPLVPTWMGALGGATMLVFASTLRNARGDLCRSMGMRLVAVVEELLDINADLKVVQKSGVVAGRILDKILILDRKHSIKDRIAAGFTFMYEQISSATGRMDRRRDDVDRNEGRRRDSRDEDMRREGGNRDTRRPNDQREYRRQDDGRNRDYERPDDRKDFRRTPGEASIRDRRDDFPRDGRK